MTNWPVGKVASYDGVTLKVTELFSNAILQPMFVYGVLDFINLSAMGVAEIADYTHLKAVHILLYLPMESGQNDLLMVL